MDTNHRQELDHDSLFEDDSDRVYWSPLPSPRSKNPLKYGLEQGHLLTDEQIIRKMLGDSVWEKIRNGESLNEKHVPRAAAGQIMRNEYQPSSKIEHGVIQYNEEATQRRRDWLNSLNSPYGSEASQESIGMEISPDEESQNGFTHGHHPNLEPAFDRTPHDKPSSKTAGLHSHSDHQYQSKESQRAIDMVMSPQDWFLRTGEIICVQNKPKLIGCPSTILPPQSKNFLSPSLQDRYPGSDFPDGLFRQQDYEAQRHGIRPTAGMGGSSSMFLDHYPLSLSEKLMFKHLNGDISGRPIKTYENKFQPDTPKNHISQRSSSPIPTPSHITPPHHSPLKWVDSPSRSKRMIHQSVENDLSSHQRVRESTPAYEDRSPSPSPISRTDKTHERMVLDTMIFEAPCRSSAHKRGPSPPPTPEMSQGCPADIMRPPPSPSRTQAASPGAESQSFREASPSTLRSPAIARVLNQSHSPHRHARYPSMSRSVSPEARPHHQYFPSQLNLSSVSQPQFSPPLEPDRHRASLDTATDKIRKGFSAPPPIPDSPLALKPAKRGRRKSVGANSGAKIVKNRTVTTGAGAGTSGIEVKAKGKRNVTVTKRQRAVTAGLASEKQWRQGDRDGGNGVAEVDAMDVDMDDGHVGGGGGAGSIAKKPDPNATPSPLRRSSRLRKSRP